jgi:hypothetical protein
MRLRLVLAASITAICLLAPLTPAQAGGARYIQVEKVVTGTGSPGPFTIEVVCDVTASETFDLSDGESDVIQIQNQSSESCTVTETATLGADVSYMCEDTNQGDDAAECQGGNTVTWDGDLTGAAVVVVTNDYPATTTTAPATTVTTVAPAAVARQASPTFTG